MKWTKWELSLAVGLAVMLFYCAARGQTMLQWWSAAFSPLCDGILTQSAATGGIVQGMSGSPILQNGKLVGAVTHVLLSDATKGYGISMETMLNAGKNV